MKKQNKQKQKAPKKGKKISYSESQTPGLWCVRSTHYRLCILKNSFRKVKPGIHIVCISICPVVPDDYNLVWMTFGWVRFCSAAKTFQKFLYDLEHFPYVLITSLIHLKLLK